MSNLEKYKGLFVEAFQYDGDVEKLEYQSIEDGIVLVTCTMAEIEDLFDIELDVDDIIISHLKKAFNY